MTALRDAAMHSSSPRHLRSKPLGHDQARGVTRRSFRPVLSHDSSSSWCIIFKLVHHLLPSPSEPLHVGGSKWWVAVPRHALPLSEEASSRHRVYTYCTSRALFQVKTGPVGLTFLNPASEGLAGLPGLFGWFGFRRREDEREDTNENKTAATHLKSKYNYFKLTIST